MQRRKDAKAQKKTTNFAPTHEGLRLMPFNWFLEAFAKLALKAKFDDFDVGSIFRKLTYPFGHRRFAKNQNPALKAQIWPQMEFCKSLLK
jgi:hypothetical protein